MARYKYYKRGPGLSDGIIDNDNGVSFIEGGKEWDEFIESGETPDPAETPQEIADREAEELRQSEIRAERDTSGLKQITVAQAHQYIDDSFASATTIAATKAAIKTILKKMVVHILD